MKTISTQLATHLGSDLTTLAELVRITRTDNVVVAFTSHDVDLSVEGLTYYADGAFTSEKLIQNTELKTKDYEVVGILDSALITEGDLQAGLYDHARIDVFVCNWADLSQGIVHIRRGWLGEIALSGGRYGAGLRGFHDLLTRKVGETYTPECRFCFGDTRCGVDPDAYTVAGSVTALGDARTFYDEARTQDTGQFDEGLLVWTGGANIGASCEVSSWKVSSHLFTLWIPLPYEICIGDTYKVTAGCDKRFTTCRTRFFNGLNYGGFPYLPGIGKILEYPEA
ncbi:MAG: DUF2163 domain-containing protein [Alphaproteobacteria bacterium]|nr:DUF2163 domain-containing protein [Alphaproteobacteria bacterium]